jgi:hypothetical protein
VGVKCDDTGDGEMNNEPVAIRYNFDGYGYQYMDSGSGSDWQSRVKGEPLYTHPADLMDEEIIESLAELEHEQWMKWADTIMQTEKISDSRFARWASCMIPYADLTEEMKEFDRVWARKALAILRKAQEK